MQKHPEHHHEQSGFTLVELSIVLVVIALIIGSLLGAGHIIHKVQVAKVIEQADAINQRVQAFRELYRAYPGDFDRATQIWDAASNCSSAATGKATCNGNGNGIVEANAEYFRVWHHLANADLYEGRWTGVQGSPRFIGGVNVPEGPLTNSIYVMHGEGLENGMVGHRIYFAREGGNLTSAIIAPADLAALDTKFDDGFSASGRITAFAGGGGSGNCISAGNYDKRNTLEACVMVYWLQ